MSLKYEEKLQVAAVTQYLLGVVHGPDADGVVSRNGGEVTSEHVLREVEDSVRVRPNQVVMSSRRYV